MNIRYDILFGLGCSAAFVAVVSVIWLIVGFYRARKAEIDFFNNIEKALNEAMKNEEDENANKS